MNETLEEKYDAIRETVLSSTQSNPVKIALTAMEKDFVNIHGPEHHFLDGAAFLAAYRNAGGDIDLNAALDRLAERARQMPGAMCGYWGVCGSAASVGAALSVIHGTSPLSTDEYYKDNLEFVSRVLAAMSKIGGARCCKRNAFLSLSAGAAFVHEKYGIPMQTEPIECPFSAQNKQCLGEKCPFHRSEKI